MGAACCWLLRLRLQHVSALLLLPACVVLLLLLLWRHHERQLSLDEGIKVQRHQPPSELLLTGNCTRGQSTGRWCGE